ncbi:hypothetical protein AB0B31_26225 [Catellatospora citrea]|uniref:hypothetical protein n=1 Tax=Catellatospora citrea TaxID=53366 RepID=UPI00340629BC
MKLGTFAVAGSVLWLADWAFQHLVTASADTGSTSWYIGQILAVVAALGTAGLAGGLFQAGAGGPGRFARICLAIWAFAWLLITVAAVIGITTVQESNPVYPIGGLLSTVAGIASGIVVARARVLAGWRRWAPLAFALWYGLVLGAVMATAEHSWLASAAELGTYLLMLLASVALVTARLTHRVPAAVPAAARR